VGAAACSDGPRVTTDSIVRVSFRTVGWRWRVRRVSLACVRLNQMRRAIGAWNRVEERRSPGSNQASLVIPGKDLRVGCCGATVAARPTMLAGPLCFCASAIRLHGHAHLRLGPELEEPVGGVSRPVGSPDWSMGHGVSRWSCVLGGLAVMGSSHAPRGDFLFQQGCVCSLSLALTEIIEAGRQGVDCRPEEREGSLAGSHTPSCYTLDVARLWMC
jgi:hypothetical protein